MRIKNICLWIFWGVLIVIGSCARRGVPTGGPRDTIPPTLVTMYPPLETVNFDDDEIYLEFDEYVEARSLKQDIIINPPVEDFDFYVNRQSVVVELNEDLQENTTYTFNFRDAIKDISEQNPADNIVIAFSTGSKIDSFQVQGRVTDLLTNKPGEDILVALYPEGDTLTPFEDPPMYLTKTDEEGNYAIRYIRVGTYKVFAYNDKNNNLKIDSNTEAFGFVANPVALLPEDANPIAPPDSVAGVKDSTMLPQKTLYGKTVDLALFNQDVRNIEIQSARANGKYFEIKTNKGIMDYELSADQDDLEESSLQYLDSLDPELPRDTMRYVYSNFQDNHKTIRLYQTINQDSLRAYLTVRDSVGQSKEDTLYIKFTETRREKEQLRQNFSSKSDIINYINANIEFSKPIAKVNTDSILLSYDTLFYLPLNYDELLSWNERLDKVSLRKEINKSQLTDSLISYLQKRDSSAFVKLQNQNRLYLDSLKEADEVEERLKFFNILTQNISSLRSLNDSLKKIEDVTIKNSILTELADTLNISAQTFEPQTYDREELRNTLKPLVLYISGGSFMTIENDSSQRVIQRFNFKKPSENGTITGTISTEYESYTIQLLNNNFEVVEETQPTNSSYTFDLISPGEYHIRVLVDENQNGEWDKANILENRNSEPVYFYTEEEVIDLRANWTREINLAF